MKLNITGPAYTHPTMDANNQRCVNMYLSLAGPSGRGDVVFDETGSKVDGKFVLLPTAGLLELLDFGDENKIRCLGTVGDFSYAVAGNKVYKLDINYATKTAVSTLLGTIGTTRGTVYMAANPTQIIWVDGSSEGYLYTPGSDTFETINDTDADFPGGTQVVFLEGYFIVNDPLTGRFYTSAANNGLSWDLLDVATAETNTDSLIAMGVAKGELWLFGTSSTEIWYNAANQPPGSPFSPRTNLGLQIGCGAADSVVQINDVLIWMDNRGFIVQSAVSPFLRSNNSGYDLRIISTEAITAEILSYENRSNAIAMTYNYRGHIMYQITFPSANKTWVFDYTTKTWHERAYYDSFNESFKHHLAQFYAQSNSLHLMAGILNGKVYLTNEEYLDDNGVNIHRIRTTPVLYDEDQGRLIGIERLELKTSIGNSTLTNPQIGMAYSNDGGHSWSNQVSRNLGAVGEFNKKITWNRLGTAYEWILEFIIVEPMPFSLIDANILTSIEAD